MNMLRYISIIFLIYSVSAFAQTTYGGPASGNVSGGVEVNTDIFSFVPIGNEIPKETKVMEVMVNDTEPLYVKTDGAVLDNYVYVDDGAVNSPDGVEIGLNIVIHSFESISPQGSTPPDPAMAVGPNHVISAINGRFHIYDREGNLLKNINENDWIGQLIGTPVISDPQVIYDHHNGKWVMLWFTRNEAILEAPFVICHSDDENPLGIWYMYAIGSELNGSTYAGNWGDYPKIGYDDQALYINSRQFAFAGGYQYNKLRIINSSDFYAAQGGPVSWTDIWNIRVNGSALDVIHPAYSYDTGIDTAYFAYARSQGASYYQLFKISDPITNPDLTSVQVDATQYQNAPSGVQPSGDPVDNFTWVSKAPVVRDGKLYGAHAIRNSQNTQYSSLKYFAIDLNTNLIIEEVEQGENGAYFITPAITVDLDHNIAITYSKCSSTDFIGAYYSTKLATDPLGLSPSKVMVEGQGNYTSATRWGDYFSAAIDPNNQYDIWLYSEFAKNNSWGTWLTEIRMVPFDGVHAYTSTSSIEFGNIEVGTTSDIITAILANYGDQDLVIDAIPSSMGDFNLDVSGITFPITLSSYDSLSLDFTFSPTMADSVQETFLVTSNDPVFTEFTLSGHGYVINPAGDKLMYASSGPQNDGNLLYVDRQTGAGANIGPSFHNDILSLTISPINDELLGVKSTPSESQILRVNSLGGDAYLLYTLDLGNMVAIAFDTTGTLYGAVETGEIYSIDLSNGTYQLVSTAQIELTAITFEPSTNDLWASISGGFGVPKDQIFKIDLMTGDTTLVGQTGFSNISTNDLAFDENGVLYGIKGSGPTVSDLFTININTGEGTLVGSVGLMALTGLAFAETGFVVSVDGSDDKTIPTEFSLSQNYPNPFNPETTIKFSIPISSFVTLKLYDVIGNEVKTLVNNQKSAGQYEVTLNASDLSSGIYFYKLDAGSFVETKKMVLLK